MSDGSPSNPSSAGAREARHDEYRYTVALMGAELTPLAAIEAFLGNERLRVLNVSQGGLALLFDREPKAVPGDFLDISVSVRERAFPVQIEVRGVRGLRVSSAFQNPSKAFQGALREFLRPKFLGGALVKSDTLSSEAGWLEQFSGAERFESYVGQNQTGFFVWMGRDRELLKLVGISQDLAFEWTRQEGARTGRAVQASSGADPAIAAADGSALQWDRLADRTLLHYFADICLAWLPSPEGPELMEALIGETTAIQRDGASSTLRFPKI